MKLLEVVDRVDNFTYGVVPSGLFTLKTHDGLSDLGFIIPPVVEELARFPDVLMIDVEAHTVMIHPQLVNFEQRNDKLQAVAKSLRASGKFETLQGWRDELYTVYYPSHQPYVLLERAFCPLLGVVMYGVHINGYIPSKLSTTGEIQFWIPRRSRTKATFPGMLDNTIAGGLGHPHGVLETAIKESYEEAGISNQFVHQNLKCAGVISYIFSHDTTDLTKEGALVQPEVEYICDLAFDKETIPTPVDNEAESFSLMSLKQVMYELYRGGFKPNCGLVIIDFLIRHGFITPENEPDYFQITQRIHRRIPFCTK